MWKESNFSKFLKKNRKQKINYPSRLRSLKNDHYLFRKGHYSDIRHLIAIERDAYAGEVPWGKSAFIAELSGSKPTLFIVVEDKQKSLAFIGLRFEYLDVHISNLAVRKEVQAQGIGSQLLSEALKVAKEYKANSLSLEVRKSNMDAQRLYRRFGFYPVQIKEKYYSEEQEDAVDMRLIIDKRGKL